MNYFVSIIIGAALGLFGGYALFSTPAPTAAVAEESDAMATEKMEADAHMAADHTTIEVDASKPIPAAAMKVYKDSMGGYNIQVTTQNFTFTPENAGGAVVANEGHAHVYVNDVKVSRLYGEWMHLDAKYFKSGPNTIEVTLNANDHSDWELNGEHIGATLEVAN